MVNPVIRQNKDFKVCAPTIRHRINNIWSYPSKMWLKPLTTNVEKAFIAEFVILTGLSNKPVIRWMLGFLFVWSIIKFAVSSCFGSSGFNNDWILYFFIFLLVE